MDSRPPIQKMVFSTNPRVEIRIPMVPDDISNSKLPPIAALFTAFICLLFGANAVAIKISVAGVGPFTAAAIRFTVATFALWLWAQATQQEISFQKGQRIPLSILSVIFTVQLSLFHLGISKTYASRGTLLSNFQPFFLLFLAHFFIPGDRITARKFFGLLLGFLGVAFVFLESKGITSGFRVGDLMMLSAAFLWAINGVYTKRIVSGFDPFQLVFFPMVFSVPFFFLEAWLWDSAMFTRIDARIIGSLFYQSIICAAFGFVAWTHLLKRYGAVALHSFIFLMPMAGVLLGGLLLNEPITLKIILALVLVVAGIIIVQLGKEVPAPLIDPGGNI